MDKGERMSLSAAALIAIHDMGYDWPMVRGAEYWAMNGVKLTAVTPAIPPSLSQGLPNGVA